MNRKKGAYPTKRTMNLFYKPDRTTKPATRRSMCCSP